MSRWPTLDPMQQNELLGKQTDGAVGVLDPSGDYQYWEPPVEPGSAKACRVANVADVR